MKPSGDALRIAAYEFTTRDLERPQGPDERASTAIVYHTRRPKSAPTRPHEAPLPIDDQKITIPSKTKIPHNNSSYV